jgi:hypothetical protein
MGAAPNSDLFRLTLIEATVACSGRCIFAHSNPFCSEQTANVNCETVS